MISNRYSFRPLGIYLGLRASKRRVAPTNDVLEAYYIQNKGQFPTEKSLTQLSTQLDMTPRQVERWFRIRRMQYKPSTLDKFAETG